LEFKIPDILINMSAFDEYLLRTQQMALGLKTIRDNLREDGLTNDQIDKKIQEINEENYNGNNDISINTTSASQENVKSNADGLDNNFK